MNVVSGDDDDYDDYVDMVHVPNLHALIPKFVR